MIKNGETTKKLEKEKKKWRIVSYKRKQRRSFKYNKRKNSVLIWKNQNINLNYWRDPKVLSNKQSDIMKNLS